MINPFKKYRIDRLFFYSFATLIVIVLTSTVLISFRMSSNELAQTTSHYQHKLLVELNKEISSRLQTIEQISLSLSRDEQLISYLRVQKDEYQRYQESRNVAQTLANVTYSIPMIQEIDLYMDQPVFGDSKSYIQFMERSQASGRVWFDALQDNDTTWSSEHMIPSFQGNVPVMSYARKIIYDNKYLGILVIQIKAESIRSTLAGQSTEANRLILSDTGKLLLHTGNISNHVQLSEWLQHKIDDSGYTRIRGEAGLEDNLFVYSKSPSSQWTLVEVTPWGQISAGGYKLAEAVGIIGIVAILLTLLLALWLSKQFTKPIKYLISMMSAYSLGGKKITVPMDYENEFGYLFLGYSKQNERIEELYDSLQRRHEQQRKAEIEALQANINPHFLYNTLDQLNWMAITRGQHEISRIIELMGRMFRIGLSNGESFVTLAEEVLHVESYLEIQQLRWKTGLAYTITLSSDLKKLFLPKLILQPFVENCIIHGFAVRSEGHIHINIEVNENTLNIVIEDDGVGLQMGPDAPHQRNTGGYGVRNVKERIKVYFGNRYGVVLTPRITGGTRVHITLPALTSRPDPAAMGKEQ
ncbi:cache domain-containing sensor histidine kinase [Paenibacillus aceris]|uniref:Two-component system sensor histidine kinase YesM n=1 Tax=Paenibacillus aceris TaxID=869555 RepID=A0ABS4I719_9BACL|nr:sensor histidine kinase [Paenibacillus aceris]MBP1966645.1 two-component system sensor histidine kinase YesM [Paenibacillus aceris]NHW38881.1 sensor histidine kinase [Paenibacillus aceris]